MVSRSLLAVAAVALCLLVGGTSACLLGNVEQYQHCGTDLSGTYGPCKGGYICAYGNAWFSMCVTPQECPNQKGYECNRDACGNVVGSPPPTTNCTAGNVPEFQHCGKDSTGTYGNCVTGMICSFQNPYWSMCLPPTECAKEGGYQCNRDGCGNIVA